MRHLSSVKLFDDMRTIFWMEWVRYRRDRAYWIGQLIFPLVLVVVIGSGLNQVVSLPTGASYFSHLASGGIALLVASGGVGAGTSLMRERFTGLTRILLVSPVSATSIVLGKYLARLLVSFLMVTVLSFLFLIFSDLVISHIWAIALGVAVITSGFVALGIVLGSFLQSYESFRLFSSLITIPIYLLSSLFYPLETLPLLTRYLSWVNPFTYAVELLRFGFLGGQEIPLAGTVSFLLLGGVTSLFVAVWFFRKGEGST